MATPFPFTTGEVLTAADLNATADVPRVSVYNTLDQALIGPGYNYPLFNSERFDSHGLHSTTTNTGRLTIPTGWAGVYYFAVEGNVNTSQAAFGILKNGTDRFYGDFTVTGGGAAFSCIINMNVGDYVEFSAYALGNCNLYGTNTLGGTTSPLFQGVWLTPL